VEKILEDCAGAHGLKFISLRYFNAAGADPDGRLGEMHDPESHLIPNILLYLLGQKQAFELYGTDFPTPDGTAIRDYVHVADLAAAHVLALRRLLQGSESDFINLGTNRGHSVLEVIRTVEAVTGQKVVCQARSRRQGDVPALLASKEKAEQILGWKPRYSSLEEIVETAWKWHSRSRAGTRAPR
jgi:UDP-glucose 4-epimerase